MRTRTGSGRSVLLLGVVLASGGCGGGGTSADDDAEEGVLDDGGGSEGDDAASDEAGGHDGEDGGRDGEDGGRDGDGETYDPSCHWDCFGYQECHDGVVTTWENTPVPCEYWTGECPHYESYTCERGCRVDAADLEPPETRWIDPRQMCEEWRPKQVGDPCDDPTDCDPQVATVNDAGDVINVYLRCDLETGTCVARDPTVVEGYLAPCGIEAPFGEPPGFAYGFVLTDVCSTGVCLVIEDEMCVRQGCTVACDFDDDCPMGSVCEYFLDWTGRRPAGGGNVCKPGPPRLDPDDLVCP